MSVTAGDRLGPYEILDPLGAGGMGEVYRARDTRLDRLVAIKVLSRQLSADPELRQRFEREARAISSLNHPHICALFDVGDMAAPEPIPFLVMELVDGESLASRLTRGPLPLVEALQRGIEIADALSSAHRRGIVHRDVKPGNVMLTKAGAKLLDFGLAKSGSRVNPRPVTAGPRVTTTSPPDLTAHGTILGTCSVHGAGAARRSRRRCSHGYLRVRRDALRDDHRPEGIRGQDAGEPDRRDSQGSAADGLVGDRSHSTCARSRDHEVSGQGSRSPLAGRQRFAGRVEVDRRGRLAGGWADAVRGAPAATGVGGVGALRDRPRADRALSHRLPAETPSTISVVRFTLSPPEGVTFAPRGAPVAPFPAVSPDGTQLVFVAQPRRRSGSQSLGARVSIRSTHGGSMTRP